MPLGPVDPVDNGTSLDTHPEPDESSAISDSVLYLQAAGFGGMEDSHSEIEDKLAGGDMVHHLLESRPRASWLTYGCALWDSFHSSASDKMHQCT